MSAPAPRSGDLVGRKLGKYELLALTAVGGTAEIYLARIAGEAGFEKYLVVKSLLDHLAEEPEFVKMFLDEARLGAQLDHSNIVQTLELGREGARYYMVMEYLAGMSLAQIARRTQERVPGGLMPVDLVLGLAAQACAGLHYAHERSVDGKRLNLIHRDISPQNLVVTFEGILKIVDFGIAKSDVRETNTVTGTIKGKFAYMAPEQCLAKDIDRRTDIFALGTLVHELLTGRRLFKRSSTYDTYQAIVNGRVPPPSAVNTNLGADLDELVMKALAYERDERYPTAEAFGEALLSTLHRRGTSVGAGDVARFLERHFSKELDEHGEQMRELISGRASTSEGSWDEDDGGDEAEVEVVTVDPSVRETREIDTGEVGAAGDDSGESFDLSELLDDSDVSGSFGLDDAGDFDDDDEDDEEGPTRVELNPADRIASFHRRTPTERPGTERPQTEPGTAPGVHTPHPSDPASDPRRAASDPASDPRRAAVDLSEEPNTLRGTGAPQPPDAAAAAKIGGGTLPMPAPPHSDTAIPRATGAVAFPGPPQTLDRTLPGGTEPPPQWSGAPPMAQPSVPADYPSSAQPYSRAQPPVRRAADATPLWQIAVVFLGCAGAGLGITMLIASLVS